MAVPLTARAAASARCSSGRRSGPGCPVPGPAAASGRAACGRTYPPGTGGAAGAFRGGRAVPRPVAAGVCAAVRLRRPGGVREREFEVMCAVRVRWWEIAVPGRRETKEDNFG